jgi:serine/threonine protein kinase
MLKEGMQETKTNCCARCATLRTEEAFCSLCGLSAEFSLDPLLGQIFYEKYHLQRRIGVGSYAVVFEAEHLLRKCKVAFKILHQRHTTNPEIIARFRRESIAASRLEHPYALKVFDCGMTDGIYWSAIELVNGENLDERLARGALLSPGELLTLFRPLCEVLAEAHEKGVTHRDLKPANIIPGAGSSPAKILDYGLARVEGIEEESGAKVSGTPRYMAPEQWKGLKYADARSDIYSLGVIAYQCLSGQLPLDAETTIAWLKKHRNETPRELKASLGDKKIPQAMGEAIMQAISKDPAERPATALAFLEALQKTDPAAPKVKPTTSPEASNRPLGVWLGAAALLLASIAIILTQQSSWARPIEPPTQIITQPPTATSPSPHSAPAVVASSRPEAIVQPTSTPIPAPSTAPTKTEPARSKTQGKKLSTEAPNQSEAKPNKTTQVTETTETTSQSEPKNNEPTKPSDLQMKTVDPWKL